MAKTRKGIAYRALERAFTRKSKYKQMNYIRSSPPSHLIAHDMGNLHKKFPFKINVISRGNVQIRDRALESARQTANRLMEKKAGKGMFHLKVNKYPHHVLRENPLASGAGADRMSTGMQKAYGKSIGIAARVFDGDVLFQISCDKAHVATAKEAAKRISHKLPCKTITNVEALKA